MGGVNPADIDNLLIFLEVHRRRQRPAPSSSHDPSMQQPPPPDNGGLADQAAQLVM
jgi:hypothetical protein